MATPYDPTDPFAVENNYGNEFVPQSLKRRSAADAIRAEQVAQGPAPSIDPYEGNWGAETVRAVTYNIGNDMTTGLEALGRGLYKQQ